MGPFFCRLGDLGTSFFFTVVLKEGGKSWDHFFISGPLKLQ